MLKIIKSLDLIAVEQLVMVLYGQPGIGKSTLAFTSEAPLLLDFDKGAYRAANRQDIVQINSWTDIIQITKEDLMPYKSLIIDTAGRALDFLTTDILKENYKLNHGGALTLQGYGVLKTRFTTWLNTLKTLGKDIILIAHANEEKKGDEILERLDVQGGSKTEIYKSADAMGRIYIEDKKRMISFSPTDTAFGKNPGNLDIMTIPDISSNNLILAELIFNIKEKLNQLSEIQKIRQEKIAQWKKEIDSAKSAGDFNDLVTKSLRADQGIIQIVKGIIHQTATNAGFLYEKNRGYVEAEVAQ